MNTTIPICPKCGSDRVSVRIAYGYINDGEPWSEDIGHCHVCQWKGAGYEEQEERRKSCDRREFFNDYPEGMERIERRDIIRRREDR